MHCKTRQEIMEPPGFETAGHTDHPQDSWRASQICQSAPSLSCQFVPVQSCLEVKCTHTHEPMTMTHPHLIDPIRYSDFFDVQLERNTPREPELIMNDNVSAILVFFRKELVELFRF
eukprot:scpid101522/ scgid23156/ 